MTEETQTYRPVMFNAESLPIKPKVRWWHWVSFYAFNLYRKPLVWKKQKELEEIFKRVKLAIDTEVLPELWQNRLICPDCLNAYMALKPQIFLSQIKSILKMMRCEFHPDSFDKFLVWYSWDFTKSEEIAAWINGFSK